MSLGKCRYCFSTNIIKNGTAPSGYRQFYCNDCFGSSTTLADGKKYRVKDKRKAASKKAKTASKEAKTIPPDVEVKFREKLPRGNKFIFTCAQNATPAHDGFLKSLKLMSRVRGAKIVIVPMRYKNPTSSFPEYPNEYWVKAVQPFLHNQRMQVNKHLIALGDAKVVATAVRPLTGFEAVTGGCSGIVGHPKIQMMSVATPQNALPKMMMTTGACTVKNYTDTKAGKRGEFDHSIGALYIEVKGDQFNIRQLNAEKDGSFIDLNDYFTPRGLRKAPRCEALVMGDIHADFVNKGVVKATFKGKNSIVGMLKPKLIAFHDLIDFYSRNHHHKGNPFTNIAKGLAGRDSIIKELERAAAFIEHNVPKGTNRLIVPSNHNDALTRWIFEGDWKTDPANAELYLETALHMVRGMSIGKNGLNLDDPFGWWMSRLLDGEDNIILKRDAHYSIKGIELGMHGDLGPNGSRGSLVPLSKIGVKTIVGHCLTEDHLVLTKSGWERIATACPTELLGFQDGRNVWTPVEEKQSYDYTGNLVTIKSQAFRQTVTANHKLHLKDGSSLPIAEAILTRNPGELPLTAEPCNYGDYQISEETLRKVVATCAGGGFDNGKYLRFNFKKQRKIDRLIKLFGGDLTHNQVSAKGNSRISVKQYTDSYKEIVKHVDPANKRLPQSFMNLSPENRDILLDELTYWDGTFIKAMDQVQSRQYSTFKEDEANLVASLCALQGYRVTMNKRSDSRGYILSWCVDRDHSFASNKWQGIPKRIEGWGAAVNYVEDVPVHCFTTGTHNFWVMDAKTGLVSLTSNSHTPGIEGGAYQVGTSSELKLEYTRGPSSWLNCHCLIYGNGKRTMIFIVDGKWKLT